MSASKILEELYYRKSDGIGLTQVFPKIAKPLLAIFDLLPKGIQDFDDATLAHVSGAAVEHGIKLSGVAADILIDGDFIAAAEEVLFRAVEAGSGKTVALCLKEALNPGSTIEDLATDHASIAIGVAVSLGVYETLKKASDHLHAKEAAWHIEHGKAIFEGSDLQKWIGAPVVNINPLTSALTQHLLANPAQVITYDIDYEDWLDLTGLDDSFVGNGTTVPGTHDIYMATLADYDDQIERGTVEQYAASIEASMRAADGPSGP